MDDPANLWGDADSAPVVPESVEKPVEKTSVSVEVLQQSESDEKQTPPTVPPLVISAVKNMSHLQPDTPSPLSAVGNSVPTSSILPPPSSAGTAAPLDPSSVTSSHAEADTEEVNGSLEQNGDIQPVEKKERSLEPLRCHRIFGCMCCFV
ncbi:hypothetical protein BC829DRAFT_159141 [Chytridium lagenaria]|nr:hypothetical protein BC829DRAFT_159141 [Chytridium lagenaria]